MRYIDKDAALEDINDAPQFSNEKITKFDVAMFLNSRPATQPPLEEFEWCTDCKEYDHERHCCHRFTKVIRQTVEELKVVRCKDCRYAKMTYDGTCKYCTYLADNFGINDAVYFAGDDYCSHAERRTDG